MKQIYTGKVESATFSNPPENSIIEFLWRDDKQLVANEIAINFADPEFLAFIKEYPLEKIEKAAKAVARARSKAKKAYDQNILDEFFKSNPVSIQERIIEKDIIIYSLDKNHGNVVKTVKQLEIGKTAYYDKLKRYSISPKEHK